MKKNQKTMIAMLVLILFFSIQVNAQKYLIKSGYVEYELSGSTTGTKKMWWDNYGNKSRTEIKSVTKTKILGFSSEEKKNTVDIINGKDIYSVDLDKKTGVKSTNEFANDLTKDLTDAEKKKLGEDMIAAFGGKKVGSEKILGENCDIYTVMGTKSWLSPTGVLLKSEASLLGITANEKAIKFEKNVSVGSDKFEPIKGVKYEDIAAKQKEAFGNMFDMMDDESSDEEYNIVPVKYSYDKFKKVINSFSVAGYTRTMMHNDEGQYVAMFAKGMNNFISITLTSMKNKSETPAKEGFEKFNAKGKTCYYGKILEEGATALMVEYPKNDMYLLIVEKPNATKNSMVSHLDKLNF